MLKPVKCLVYEYKERVPHRDVLAEQGVRWDWVDKDVIRLFFASQPNLNTTFSKFLNKGFIGLVLSSGDNWLTYCWMTTPYSRGPHHLPAWVKDLNAYWIFYSHTHEKYRGRGFYKAALQCQINRALQDSQDKATIYIDTAAQNIPSRRAIIASNFEPTGVITCYKLKFPKLKSFVYGKWNKDQEHPPLETGVIY